MLSNNKRKVFIILNLIILNIISETNGRKDDDMNEDMSGWVDPGDMFTFDSMTKTNIKTSDPTGKQTTDECICEPKTVYVNSLEDKSIDTICDNVFNKLDVCQKDLKILKNLSKTSTCNHRITTFVTRAVLKLINRLKSFDLEETDDNPIQISTFVIRNNVQIVEKFINQNSLVCDRVEEFEDTITEAIDALFLINNSKQSFTSNFVENHLYKSFIFIITIISIFFIYKLYCMRWSRRLATIYCLVLIISFTIEWIKLYHIKFVNNHVIVSTASMGCIEMKNKEITFTSMFSSYMKPTTEECNQYYRALMVNPIFEVNPLTAISSALANALFTPISILSDQLGKGLSKFYSHFSYLGGIFLTIPLTIIFTLMLCLYMGYSIKLPYFLGSIVRNASPPVQYLDNSNNRITQGLTSLSSNRNAINGNLYLNSVESAVDSERVRSRPTCREPRIKCVKRSCSYNCLSRS